MNDCWQRDVQFVNLSSSPISKKLKSSANRTEDRDNAETPTYEDTSSTYRHYERDKHSGNENTDSNEQTPAVNEHGKENGTRRIPQMLSPLSRWPTGVDRRPSDGHRSAVQGLLALGLETSTASPSLVSADLSPTQALSSPIGIEGWDLSAEPPEIDSLQRKPSGSSDHCLEHNSSSGFSAQHRIPRENELSVKNLLHEPSELLHSTNYHPTPTAEEIPLDEWKKAQLLRHYRYEVATWVCQFLYSLRNLLISFMFLQLDICDTNQSFGISATQLALGTAPFGPSNNPTALSTILSMAEMSHSRLKSNEGFFDHMSPGLSIFENSTTTPVLEQHCSRVGDLTPESSDLRINNSALSSALCAALEKVKQTISNVHHAWTRTGTGVDHLGLVGSLVPYASEKSLRSAIYWLLLRLGMLVLSILIYTSVAKCFE